MCNVSFAARMLAVTLIALMAFIPSCARQSDEVLVQPDSAREDPLAPPPRETNGDDNRSS